MRFLLVFVLFFVFACSQRSYEKPEDLAVAFWQVMFFEPSKCEDFMRKHMAVQVFNSFMPASEEQARFFCSGREKYIALYTKPINITAEVENRIKTPQGQDVELVAVSLHTPKGEPTIVKNFLVKIKERWYIAP